MKRILLTALFACLSVSPWAFSAVGDTYYCVMVANAGFAEDKVVESQLQKFTFRWKTDEIVFGQGGRFNERVIPLQQEHSTANRFIAGTPYEKVMFREGRFRYAFVTIGVLDQLAGLPEADLVLANCDKFDD